MDYTEFLDQITKKSKSRINSLHRFGKKLWNQKNWEPMDIRNKCLEEWDYLADEIGSKINPIIPLPPPWVYIMRQLNLA